ncbi:DUF3656 domain-containing protein [Ruminococcus sp.]|uniref:U32 family peptidase n=1 Tax=Ruminococcus sp. TaxID=41978 RepID=UPI0028732FE6|nr:DUF3656 domain-containing protein [Ruminococcus sp.]
MRNKIEILAPAGGMDSVIAAVHSGADAVYIGAKAFSARASAHNFDDDELRECVRYCHQRGVDVHLALNTLIFDDEMQDALELVKTAAKADIDALIIQDLGLVSLIKKTVPDLPLHASTQLTVHTPYGARALYEMGFERVVLSRELSLEEIKKIHESCPEVELEVFVHGALCMCVSGQCFFSAMLGGRSANRGMCAQPCRLPMRYGENDHALSLKDNGSLHYLRELQELGIASAKIEGRMKRPEYVAAATIAAREARDLGFITDQTADRLRSVFSRTGFTDGYLRGEIGGEMFGFRQKSDVVSADGKLLKEIRVLYKDEYKRIPVRFDFQARTGEKMRLTASDGTHTVTAESDEPVERAVNLPLSGERAAQSLKKTGNTPYTVEEITTDIAPDAAASASAINALRRKALEELNLRREKCHNYKINDIDIADELCDETRTEDRRRAIVRTLDFPDSFREFDVIFVDVFGLDDHERLKESQKDGFHIGVEAPRVTFGNEEEVFGRLKALRELGVQDLMAHNIAAVYMGKMLGYTVHAGFGMNIANSYTLKWAKEYGIASAQVSVEADLGHIERMRKCIPVGIIRYGYLPLMITRSAPAGESCKSKGYLQDRKNERFPVVRREGYSEIYNCVPLLMPQKDYPLSGEVMSDFLFTVENSVDNMENIMRKIRKNQDFERMTHGLYLRGVKKFTIY